MTKDKLKLIFSSAGRLKSQEGRVMDSRFEAEKLFLYGKDGYQTHVSVKEYKVEKEVKLNGETYPELLMIRSNNNTHYFARV